MRASKIRSPSSRSDYTYIVDNFDLIVSYYIFCTKFGSFDKLKKHKGNF